MNRKHGMFTTNLKSAVEITGTRANSKKGKGRKIKEMNNKSGYKICGNQKIKNGSI